MYVAALNNIFIAMRGLRIFERFGFDLPKDIIKVSGLTKVVHDYAEWHFHSESYDWLNIETGNPLTNFFPSPGLEELMNSKIDLKQE